MTDKRTKIEEVRLFQDDCLVEVSPGLMVGVQSGQIGLFTDLIALRRTPIGRAR